MTGPPQTRKSCLRKLMGELFVVLEKSLVINHGALFDSRFHQRLD